MRNTGYQLRIGLNSLRNCYLAKLTRSNKVMTWTSSMHVCTMLSAVSPSPSLSKQSCPITFSLTITARHLLRAVPSEIPPGAGHEAEDWLFELRSNVGLQSRRTTRVRTVVAVRRKNATANCFRGNRTRRQSASTYFRPQWLL